MEICIQFLLFKLGATFLFIVPLPTPHFFLLFPSPPPISFYCSPPRPSFSVITIFTNLKYEVRSGEKGGGGKAVIRFIFLRGEINEICFHLPTNSELYILLVNFTTVCCYVFTN